MTCTKCGNEIPDQAKFCPLCGASTPEDTKIPRFCMFCGASVDTDTQFCEQCGQRIAPLEDSPAKEAAESFDPSEVSPPQSQNDAVSAPVSPLPQSQANVAPAPASALPQSQVAGSAVASAVKAEVVHAAGKAATSGVRSAGRTAKLIAVWTLVVAFVIGLASACLSHFVPSPEETVDALMSSIESLDYETMLNCLDSKTGSQFRAMLGITGDLFGSITGIGIDFEDLLALAPSMGSYLDTPELGDCEAETVLYTDYSAAKIQQLCEQANNGSPIESGYISDNAIISFLHEYHITLPGLENLLAETAIVKITLSSGDVGYLPMVNEGNGDWRVLMPDLMGSFLE